MFQNPYYKQTSPYQHKQQERPSVQQIMQKYQRIETSGTIGRNSDRVAEQLWLGSMNDTNQLNESHNENKVFKNPLPPRYEQYKRESRQVSNRMTFGENQIKDQNNSLMTDDLYQEMNQLRDKVTFMLSHISQQMKNDNDKKQIQQQLSQQAAQIQLDYQKAVDKFNNRNISNNKINNQFTQNKEKEIDSVFKLVEEFLNKFSNLTQEQSFQASQLKQKLNKTQNNFTNTFQTPSTRKINPNILPTQESNQKEQNLYQKQFSYTQTQNQSFQSSIMSSQHQTPQKNYYNQQIKRTSQPIIIQQRSSTQAIKNKAQHQFSQQNMQEQQQQQKQQIMSPIEMSRMEYFPNKLDSSIYQAKELSIQKVNDKLEQLRIKLKQELDQEEMPYTKNILIEMISNLTQIIDTSDSQLVKTIIYKIEQGIQQLNENQKGSMDLYKYLNKAIMHSKLKNDLYNQKGSIRQSQVQQEIDRISMLPTQMGSINGSMKYSIGMSNMSQQSIKRQFFDAALAKKNQLPNNHPGRTLLINDLYEEYMKKGFGDIHLFIGQRFNN